MTARPGVRRAGAIRLTVFVVAAAVASYFGWRAWRAQPIVLDDSFISLRYAENLVLGKGLVFNEGERVEGYTNFLWVLLAAAAMRLGADGFAAVQALGVASYHAIVLVGAAVVVAAVPRERPAALVILPVLAVLVVPDGYAAFAGTGLETHFIALWVLVLGITQHLVYPRRRALRLLVSLVPLVVTLTRLDAGVFVVASAAATLATREDRGHDLRAALLDLVRRFGPWVVGMTVCMLWRRSYYGDFLPNTYYAKMLPEAVPSPGWTYVQAFLGGSPQVVLLVPAALLAAVAERRPRWRPFAIFAGAGTALFVAYVVHVGGDFMQYRFVFEAIPVFFCLSVLGLVELSARSSALAGAIAVLVFFATRAPVVLDHEHYGMATLQEMNDCCGPPGVRYGKRLHDILPPNTTISTTMAGGLPFYSKLPTIDQLGLTDAHVAHDPPYSPWQRGHVRRANDAYLRERGVNLVIGHPALSACSAPDVEDLPNVFMRIEGDQCLRSWYLTQTPELTAYLCAHPVEFVLHDVECPSP